MTHLKSQELTTAVQWLTSTALPLWSTRGIDPQGGFQEALDAQGNPVLVAKRCMVQARQIYSFRIAQEAGWLTSEIATPLMEHGLEYMLSTFSMSNGAFFHSVNPDQTPANNKPDLYTQAFALFGLAQGYRVFKRDLYKKRALEILQYLTNERLVHGGFSEVGPQGPQYHSNPHMHLFEAAIAWMECSPQFAGVGSPWRIFAEKILALAERHFIDPQTGHLAEYFDSHWEIEKTEGRFVFEPGHQYEWAWLMFHFQSLTGKDLSPIIQRLVTTSDALGINKTNGFAWDEVWSDGRIKAQTHRFWPQGERVKACVVLGQWPAADQALAALLQFFNTTTPGLWFDRKLEDGQFKAEPSRASSLYHIIGAIYEYHRLSP